MKQLPKAIDRNGDLWVPAATKHLVFRALKDVRQALEASNGLQASQANASSTLDHGEELKSLAIVQELLGADRFDRPLPPVNEQLGEPTARESQIMRNLFKLRPV